MNDRPQDDRDADGPSVALHVGQLLQRVPGGIGRYTRALIRELPPVGVQLHTFAAGDPSVAVAAGFPDFVQLGHPYAPVRYELWHRLRAPRIRVDGDLIHAPSMAIPPKGDRPLVVTVHDVAFLRHPELFTKRGVSFHRRGLELTRRDATAVITPSRFTHDELVREGFDPGRIHVIPHGIAAEPGPITDDIRRRLGWVGVDPPFVLFVGTLEPRKGLPILLEAMAAVRCAHPDVTLVVSGQPGWGDVPELDAPFVRKLGFTDNDVLDALYRCAVLVAVPSRYEGFGLPALEAMARGTPVVASNAASLPEVVGDAGILVEPQDVAGWAEAIGRVIEDDDERVRLQVAGSRRAAGYTWLSSARAHRAAYIAATRASSSGQDGTG
ncbi:MAG: glycosyltransferase [Actinomycetia bacterium]|nr:glycosyltransferase [Actinomycetes bacterium]